MFAIGLNQKQLKHAEYLAGLADRKTPIYGDYTNARGKPVLMVHLLRLKRKQDQSTVVDNVPALSVNFPHLVREDDRPIECVVGKVWLRQFENERFDSPDDEDDYDD